MEIPYATEQQAYLDAVQKLNDIKNEINNRLPKLERVNGKRPKITDEYRKLENELTNELGYYPALDSLIEAEERLISWGQTRLKKLPAYKEHEKSMDSLFIRQNEPIVRAKILEELSKTYTESTHSCL